MLVQSMCSNGNVRVGVHVGGIKMDKAYRIPKLAKLSSTAVNDAMEHGALSLLMSE